MRSHNSDSISGRGDGDENGGNGGNNGGSSGPSHQTCKNPVDITVKRHIMNR